MPDITRRRNSEDDNILEDEEEAAEDEARLNLIFQRWMHCSINSGNFLNLFQFILINYLN